MRRLAATALVWALLGSVHAEQPPASPDLSLELPGEVELQMKRIPAGSFLMGSPEDERGRHTDEVAHQVTIRRPFFIGVYELTQEQWLAVMPDMPSEKCDPCRTGPRQPMTCISWQHISGPGGFLETLNARAAEWGLPTNGVFRLPTEAEWEYAARAGTDTRYSFGDALGCDDDCEECALFDSHMVWCGNSHSCTEDIGTRQPNPWGLYDMHGNAWEWVEDHFGRYTAEAQIDPQGPAKGTYHGIRGCSWTNQAITCRSAARNGDDRNHVGDILGFRLVWQEREEDSADDQR